MQALPYVNSHCVMWPALNDYSIGEFSSHWAAVAALIRLSQPDFVSIGGDAPADLLEEAAMRARLVEGGRLPESMQGASGPSPEAPEPNEQKDVLT